MGVGKGNVEVVDTDPPLFLFIYEDTARGKHCCGHPSTIAQDRLRLSTLSSCYTRTFFAYPGTSLLVLQELLTPDFWRATGEVTLLFGRGEGGPSERCKGGSTKAANAVLAFAFPPGNTLVACTDDPLHLRGNSRQPPSKWAPVLFRRISCFFCTA